MLKKLLIVFFVSINFIVFPSDYPETKFIVFSDPHLFNKSLGINGIVFEKYLTSDKNMVRESEEILDELIEKISKENADFVIISGDLTKDGEKINHKIFSEKLKKVTESGKKVLVIDGNHDVRNGESERYFENKKFRVENIDAKDFKNIYFDYGYKDAIEKDTNSLSYVSEPVKGLQILMIDSCLWKKNVEYFQQISAGKIEDSTLIWIENVLKKAKDSQKEVIAVVHHGVLEHYKNNKLYFSSYILSNNDKTAELFSKYGVKIVFTGHFHAQDITLKTFKNGTLYDIETGSLVLYPNPYRIITISKDQTIKLESRFIDSIPSHKTDFRDFAKNHFLKGFYNKIYYNKFLFFIQTEDRKVIAKKISTIFFNHIKGDEPQDPELYNFKNLGFAGSSMTFFTNDLVKCWANDLPPEDNNITIDLETGNWK
jgi:3',5'-cyclic AMP phosphodiesterase CpdA